MQDDIQVGDAVAERLRVFLDRLEANGPAMPEDALETQMLVEAAVHLVDFAEVVEILARRLAAHGEDVRLGELRG